MGDLNTDKAFEEYWKMAHNDSVLTVGKETELKKEAKRAFFVGVQTVVEIIEEILALV